MSFKKIHPELKEALERLKITEPLPFQKVLLPKIKGGASVFALAPEGSGKTTTLVMSTLQKLKCEEFEDAPRALIFVKDKQAALDLKAEFDRFTFRMSVRTYCAYEEQGMDDQRDDIYDGVDVVIATPKRLNRIFYTNGINLNRLELFIVEDAEFLIKPSLFSEVIRTPESIDKCQYLVFGTKFDDRMQRMQDSFMASAQIVKL
ncbi:DEAD/DEAH box helicase [Cellulophaga fucicola]|uniref:DEAD/DEAH box helicase n=1 Tax=Cellulophaga fucicola TaxID=76595 RepID=UPI003EB8D90C